MIQDSPSHNILESRFRWHNLDHVNELLKQAETRRSIEAAHGRRVKCIGVRYFRQWLSIYTLSGELKVGGA